MPQMRLQLEPQSRKRCNLLKLFYGHHIAPKTVSIIKEIPILKSKLSSRNRILLLVPGFPKDEDDSTCIPALQQHVYHFAKFSPDIHVGVIAFQYPYIKRKYSWYGIEVYPCGGEGRRRFGRLITWLTAIKYILRMHFNSKILLIHSFWLEECAFVGQLMSKILFVKHIASIMGQDALQSNLYLKYLSHSSMIITAGSYNAADIFYNSTGHRVNAIIPIGLDIENFSTKMKKQIRKIDILGVGSLMVLKNYRLFIEIIWELAKNFPEINAAIIGDGVEHDQLKHMIIENGLENNIELLGQLSRPETIEYMYQSRIFLHTSKYESQGYVFLEALYCGLTVVCFDVGFVEKSERMLVCSGKSEMVENLKRILKQKLTCQPILLKSINETVNEFNHIYKL
jgi:glycosyltransferase involved in cell wall biosynthesis